MKLVYVNVNEDGVPYQTNNSLEPALVTLDEYPNDSIVITYQDSPEGVIHEDDLP